MTTRVAACGLLCLLAACSVPSHRVSTHRDTSTSNPAAIPQNYAPNAMFMKEHGEFMLRREPWRPEAQVTGLIMSDAEVKGEAGDFNLRHLRADFERRIHMADPNIFVDAGVQYGVRDYSFSKAAPNGTPPNASLHRATANVQYGQFLDQDTLVEVDFTPGVWTDFGGTLHHDDWQFYAKGLLTWRYSNEIFLMGGAEYSGLFRGFEAYPLLGAAWIPDEAWRVDALLPRQVRLSFLPNPHNTVFLSVDLDGGEYRIRAPSPAQTQRKISVQEFEVSLGAQHRFNHNVSAMLRIGTTIGGHYEWRSTPGAGTYDGTLEPQAFAEVGVGWTF